MDKLKIFKNSKEWKKENGKYVPMPITWLQQKRWEDEVEASNKSKANKSIS